MKRTVLLIMVLSLLLSLSACGTKPEPVYEGEYASQEAFLEAMAKGISNRLKNVDDGKQYTDEEKSEHYVKLVTYELDQIVAYEDLVFEDPLFNELAHGYISACKMQLIGAQNYKNSNLYNPLWNGGSTIRNGIICEFYTRYNLPITADEASQYSPSSGSVSYTVSGDTEVFDWFNDDGDIVLSVGELVIEDASISFNKAYSAEYDCYECSFVVRNHSEYSLESLSIHCVITDSKGNILGAESGSINNTIPSKKSATLEFNVYLKDYPSGFHVVPDYFYYDCNGDYIVYDLDVESSNAKRFTLKTN